MKRYCLALDLVDDRDSIAAYEAHHRSVSAAILSSMADTGILRMELFRAGNRLFMILETKDSFTFEAKEKIDRENPEVQAWEALMWKYQRALPFARPGEKWVQMNQIFDSGKL